MKKISDFIEKHPYEYMIVGGLLLNAVLSFVFSLIPGLSWQNFKHMFAIFYLLVSGPAVTNGILGMLSDEFSADNGYVKSCIVHYSALAVRAFGKDYLDIVAVAVAILCALIISNAGKLHRDGGN